jgi:hypothetical protein
MRRNGVPKARSIPISVKFEIWSQPCAVCGLPFDINVDHIIPVACGGTNDRGNLQPLCRACNHIKGCRLSNSEVADAVLVRGPTFFLVALFNHESRFRNPYDGYSIDQWLADAPHQQRVATRMFKEFSARWLDA